MTPLGTSTATTGSRCAAAGCEDRAARRARAGGSILRRTAHRRRAARHRGRAGCTRLDAPLPARCVMLRIAAQPLGRSGETHANRPAASGERVAATKPSPPLLPGPQSTATGRARSARAPRGPPPSRRYASTSSRACPRPRWRDPPPPFAPLGEALAAAASSQGDFLSDFAPRSTRTSSLPKLRPAKRPRKAAARSRVLRPHPRDISSCPRAATRPSPRETPPPMRDIRRR